MEETVSQLESMGLGRDKARETCRNEGLTRKLLHMIGIEKTLGHDKQVGKLCYILATKTNNDQHMEMVFGYICRKEIQTEQQVDEAVKFLQTHDKYGLEEFRTASGIGIEVGDDEIQKAVDQAVRKNHSAIAGGKYLVSRLIKDLKKHERIKWVNGSILKKLLEEAIDHVEKVQQRERKELCLFRGELAKFHRPGENPQLNEEITRRHLEATGGKVVTRFPPEPNGLLHIGHAKAINLNFKYAQYFLGATYLRYDDTNPEGEEKRYFDRILEDVEWLGFRPSKITHASDYFPQLYEYALQLIRKGLAYVCHQTPEEINTSRGGKDHRQPLIPSPWRDRPIDESLCLFQHMKDGKFRPGEATLRLKMDLASKNPFMWDLVAYRILDKEHVRTGKQWCIYPMYDFTHCLCDSIENITHSLCTTEFVLAREAYYWVCDALGVYKPVQWEYGRLNLTRTILSKRKLTKLVETKVVKGWDDPRLYTIAGIRRRGFTPRAINRFIEHVGITTNITTIDTRLLEHFVREDLNEICPRIMGILDPLMVVIEDLDQDYLKWISIASMTGQESKSVPVTRVIYIDQTDFRIYSDSDFYRFASDQPVGLLQSFTIECTNYAMDGDRVVKVFARTTFKKPLAHIQWIAECSQFDSPVKAEVRVYSDLFDDHAQVSSSSLVVKNGFVDIRVRGCSVGDRFQFQRVGYFCIDPDSDLSMDQFVFNRIVTLREDPRMNKQ